MSCPPLAHGPTYLCMRLKNGSSADAATNSTHSPISHLPLSLEDKEQGRTRERVEIGGEGER